jgi:hypothetical protein
MAKTNKKNIHPVKAKTYNSLGLTEREAFDLVDIDKKGSKADQRRKYCTLRLFGLSVQDASKSIGYLERYGYELDKKFQKDSEFAQSVLEFFNSFPDKYRTFAKSTLLPIAQIEQSALVEYAKDPKLAINKPQLLKQLKQGAGVLESDTPAVQTISVKTINVMQRMIMQDLTGAIDTEVGDAKVIE